MAKAQRKQELDIEGRKVTLSNLEKVLYPENGWTKAQVIDFYIRIAPVLLPHFHNRPVTLKRFPDGVGSQAFYEKDAPKFKPEWVTTFPVPRRAGGKPIQYVLINDLPSLVWCANIASLELHPFLHCAPEIDHPTALVFDLDPGEGANILTCARVAFLVRESLREAGLECFPKVSGSKGLQLYVPLNTGVSYEAARPFAKAFAEALAGSHPDLIVAEMAKVQRPHKIFIDWSQNSDFKTTIGVYSLRAKAGRPFVSLPVSWDELQHACDAGQSDALVFTPEKALERVAALGDLFAPVLAMRQSLAEKRKALRRPEKSRTTPPRPKAQLAPEFNEIDLPESKLSFIEPMQALPAAELPDGKDWQYEVKLDGYRALAIKAGGEVRLLSRRNNSYNSKFAPIAEALRTLEDGIILDGEVVALDEQGRPSFNLLQHYRPGKQPLVFYVFDLPAYRGRDITGLPLSRRRALLESLLPRENGEVRLSAVLDAPPKQLIEAVREQGLEGVIAKRKDSRYEVGERSGRWVKVRTNQGQELVVGGYRPSGKNRFDNPFDNLAVGYYEGKRLMFIAKLKNGFTPQAKEEIFARLEKLGSTTCPFANLPEPKNARRGEALTAEAMKNYRWIKPKLVVQAEFTDWTSADHLRHARYVGIRDDKDAREVVREAVAKAE